MTKVTLYLRGIRREGEYATHLEYHTEDYGGMTLRVARHMVDGDGGWPSEVTISVPEFGGTKVRPQLERI
jgi:hypothetical protein